MSDDSMITTVLIYKTQILHHWLVLVLSISAKGLFEISLLDILLNQYIPMTGIRLTPATKCLSHQQWNLVHDGWIWVHILFISRQCWARRAPWSHSEGIGSEGLPRNSFSFADIDNSRKKQCIMSAFINAKVKVVNVNKTMVRVAGLRKTTYYCVQQYVL